MFFKDSFAEHSILVFFSLGTLKIFSHCFLDSIVAVEKSAVSLIVLFCR